MLIIDKYFLRELLKTFGIILVAVVSIFLVIDFFEKIDDFVEAGLPLYRAAVFFGLRIPFVVAQIAPVAILLSILIVLGLMNKRNELFALRGGGVGMTIFLRVLLPLSLLFAVLLFLIADILVPITFSKANRLYAVEVDKKAAVATKGKNIWIRGKRTISNIKYYNPSKQTISGISLYFFDDKFRLVRRVDAATGRFGQGRWIFKNVVEQDLETPSNEYRIAVRDQHSEPLDLVPDDLKRVAKKSEEMNFLELFDYIRSIEDEGYDATVYKVDLQAKLAFPFVCFVLSILALGIGTRKNLKDSLSVVVSLGIGLLFAYWMLYSFCLSLGYGGVLPPLVAAWLANAVFLSAGVLTLATLE